jgi:hypothetical protein
MGNCPCSHKPPTGPRSSAGGRLDVRAYDPGATGDGGESRGLWQINRIYHPEVSDQCAYNVECSTDWALQRIMDGNINEWSTWKYRKLWFRDSPI